jgi:hypothetical protein
MGNIECRCDEEYEKENEIISDRINPDKIGNIVYKL